jgi:hypothetical protein
MSVRLTRTYATGVGDAFFFFFHISTLMKCAFQSFSTLLSQHELAFGEPPIPLAHVWPFRYIFFVRESVLGR